MGGPKPVEILEEMLLFIEPEFFFFYLNKKTK